MPLIETEKTEQPSVAVLDKKTPPQDAVWSRKRSGKKTWLILSILIIIAGGAIALFFWNPRVKVETVQKDTVVKLDSNAITGEAKVKPGKHKIEISKKGFVPYIFNDNIKPFQALKFEVDLRKVPQPKVIVDEKAFAAKFTTDGKKFYYLGNNGKTLYEISVSTGKDKTVKLEKKAMTPDTLPPLNQVIFSPTFDISIFKKTDGDTGIYDFKRYDYVSQEYISWGANIGDIIWSPDGKKIAYYYAPENGEKPIIITDRQHKDLLRVRDLRDADITVGAGVPRSPKLIWSNDAKLISIVVENKLLILNTETADLTEIQTEGVSSAIFSPDNTHLLYTKNGQLVWQKYELVDGLSGKAEDQKDVGKVRVGDPEIIALKANAQNSVFPDKTGTKVIVIADGSLKLVDLETQQVKPFYLDGNLKDVIDMGISSDLQSLYVLSDKRLLGVPLDNGAYQSEKE